MLGLAVTDEQQSDHLVELRHAMVETDLIRRGIRDTRVVEAMNKVPREQFVAPEFREQAYEDRPLPIGEGQTVSQPYIVAVTLAALSLQGSETVLEVGTGSGYQTALLAELAEQVYSIERHGTLADSARFALQRLGYRNVEVTVGDGTRGWPERAPFDAIVVSAAAPRLPEDMFAQLREGGLMVVPVGPAEAQDLQLIRKIEGRPVVTSLNACRFVPLIGAQGYPDSW